MSSERADYEDIVMSSERAHDEDVVVLSLDDLAQLLFRSLVQLLTVELGFVKCSSVPRLHSSDGQNVEGKTDEHQRYIDRKCGKTVEYQ